MNQPLVTISIPIFKCEDFLEKCLESVRAQTYSNIEVTLINDCTPDNSVEIAEQFISHNQLQERWKIYHLEENSGLSVVRNKGIDTANGKYIFFLDSDDTITPDCIELLLKSAEKSNAEMTIGEVMGVYLETEKEFDVFPIKLESNVITGNDKLFKLFVDGSIPVHSWNKLLLIDFLRKYNLYFVKGLYAQDSLHSFHMAEKLSSISVVRKITYHYYLHKESVIHNRGKRHFDNWFTIAQYFDKSLKSESRNLIKQLILKHLIHYKDVTLLMNWKAQRNPVLWKESYRNYQKLSALKIKDYLSSAFTWETKKKNFLQNLPPEIGLKVFLKRFGV